MIRRLIKLVIIGLLGLAFVYGCVPSIVNWSDHRIGGVPVPLTADQNPNRKFETTCLVFAGEDAATVCKTFPSSRRLAISPTAQYHKGTTMLDRALAWLVVRRDDCHFTVHYEGNEKIKAVIAQLRDLDTIRRGVPYHRYSKNRLLPCRPPSS